MIVTNININDKHQIAIEDYNSLTFSHFYHTYFLGCKPVLIQNVPTNCSLSFDEISNMIDQDKLYKKLPVMQFTKNPFYKQITVPSIINTLLMSSDIIKNKKDYWRLWASPKAHATSFHYDTNSLNTFNLQISGKKYWEILIPTHDVPFHPFSSWPINCDSATYKLDKVHDTYYTFSTSPGDMIYIPAFTLHQVKTLKQSLNVNWTMIKNNPFDSSSLLAQRERELLKIGLLCRNSSVYQPLIDMTGYGGDLFGTYAGIGWDFIKEHTANLTTTCAILRGIKEMTYYKHRLKEEVA